MVQSIIIEGWRGGNLYNIFRGEGGYDLRLTMIKAPIPPKLNLFNKTKNIQIYFYLNQSTFVFGCGNMTYNEVELPANDLWMSAGHMMNGLGNSATQLGNGCFL